MCLLVTDECWKISNEKARELTLYILQSAQILKFSQVQNNSNTTRFALESHVTVSVRNETMTLLFCPLACCEIFPTYSGILPLLNESVKSWTNFDNSSPKSVLMLHNTTDTKGRANLTACFSLSFYFEMFWLRRAFEHVPILRWPSTV